MKLTSEVYLKGHRIDYEYDVATGTHGAWFSMTGKTLRGLSAGAMLNHLIPYRDNHDVQELIAWLAR